MRTYNSEDYQMISSWCGARDLAPPPEWSIPQTGILLEDVAAGFLIYTSNSCGILDFYISNPLADRRERTRAFDAITKRLMYIAKESGIKVLLANTKHQAIKKLAQKHGFDLLGDFTHFKKEL